jgi:SAM-dependent methyltransferase
MTRRLFQSIGRTRTTMTELVCPACLGLLQAATDSWHCKDCAKPYRCLRGIPDLRTIEDAYLPIADDWAFALRLDQEYDRLDFRGLLDLYYDLSPEVAPDQRARQIGHILSAPGRATAWVEMLGLGLRHGPWIDLGCGSGSFLAAQGDRDIVGIDVAMRWLLVARKRLDEEGLSRIPLVCGNAERLPFRDCSFAAVVAGDVIEHVADQRATLAEAHRVLKAGGRLFLATPNRLSLAPEPHVGVWGVGFLPRRWMAGYVHFVRRADFRAIRTLSYAGWTRLFRESPFGGASICCPALPAGDLDRMRGLKRRLAVGYNWLTLSWIGQRLLRWVGPLFHILASRVEENPTSPGPRLVTRL